jgi:AraC-like DNA-binding protein
MADIGSDLVRLGSEQIPRVSGVGRARAIYWQRHTVSGLEVNHIASGGTPALLNERPHLITPGRTYLYLPGDVFSAPDYRPSEGDTVLYWVKFEWPGWRRPSSDAAFELRRETLLAPAQQSELQQAMASMMTLHAAGAPGWSFHASAHLLRMLSILRAAREARGGGAGSEEGDERLALGIAFMERHLAERLPLTEIARAARTSADYFARLFRRRMGVPPARWLTQRRLQEGRRLLVAEPDLPIAEIGRRIGLDHPSHFARLFQRSYGASPREFRVRAAWRGEPAPP